MRQQQDSDGKIWCTQCERRRFPNEAGTCRDQFCKIKPETEPRQQRPIAPAQAIESIAHQAAAAPHGKREESKKGLNGSAQRLLNIMIKRADRDGLVMLSFNDVFDEISCSSPSGVSPVMHRLERHGYVKILFRPGGRSKTTYQVRSDPTQAWT